MTSISKNVYIDQLDDIVRKYNNTYYTSIKMKPVDVKDNTYIDFLKKVNDKNPKFKVGDQIRISKYKNIFCKGYMPNLSEEMFIFIFPMTLMVKTLLVLFIKMNCKRLSKMNLR